MRKLRLASLALVAVSFTVLLRAGGAEPTTRWSLEARVPASTLVFASAEDLGTWRERLSKTAVGRFLDDPEVKAFGAPIQRWLEGQGQTATAAGGPLGQVPPIVWDALRQLEGLHGQVALAFLGMGEQGPELVASLDFGPHAKDFVTFLGRLQQEVDPQGEHLKTVTKDGRMGWRVETPNGGPTLAATVSDTTFSIATSEALLEQTLRGASEGTLATSPDFQATRRKVGGDSPALLAHVNVAGLVERFGSEMGAEGSRILGALGLDAVTSAAYGLSFAGDGFTDTIVVQAREMDRGLLGLMQTKPLRDPSLVAFAPAGTFVFAEASVALSEVLARVRTLVSSIDERQAREMEEGLAHVSAALGVDVEKELLAGLGDGYGYHVAVPTTGGVFPEVAVLLRVKDPSAYEPVFDRFVKGLAGLANEDGEVVASTRVLEYRGKRLHLLELQKARGDDPVPFTPTWALLDDVLVVTLVPHAMKEIVLRREAGEPGLAAQKDFQTSMAQKPAGAGTVGYLNTAGAMAFLYDTGVPVLQTAVKPNMLGELPFRLDWAALPAARTVRPFWRSFATFGTSTDQGLTMSLHGPVPLLPVLAVVGAGAGLFVTRSVGSATRRPPRVVRRMEHDMDDLDRQLAEVQVEELHGKVALYLLEGKALPKDLSQLVESELLERVPADPWGRPFRLRVLDEGARTFAVESAGPDGAFGTGDDVGSKAR